MQSEGVRLRDVLPRRSLESVKALEVRHSPKGHDEEVSSWQQWPMAWSLLTALTSLSCQLCQYVEPRIPAVLNRMTRLKKLDIFHDYGPDHPFYVEVYLEDMHGADEDFAYQTEILDKVIDNTRGLTRLTSLVIDGNESLDLR